MERASSRGSFHSAALGDSQEVALSDLVNVLPGVRDENSLPAQTSRTRASASYYISENNLARCFSNSISARLYISLCTLIYAYISQLPSYLLLRAQVSASSFPFELLLLL